MPDLFHTLFVFLCMAVVGMAIGVFFDIFRAMRLAYRPVLLKHKIFDKISTQIGDILFVILSACLFLLSVYLVNDGYIAGYVVLGTLVGLGVYAFLLNKPVVIIFKYIFSIFYYIFKVISVTFKKIFSYHKSK